MGLRRPPTAASTQPTATRVTGLPGGAGLTTGRRTVINPLRTLRHPPATAGPCPGALGNSPDLVNFPFVALPWAPHVPVDLYGSAEEDAKRERVHQTAAEFMCRLMQVPFLRQTCVFAGDAGDGPPLEARTCLRPEGTRPVPADRPPGRPVPVRAGCGGGGRIPRPACRKATGAVVWPRQATVTLSIARSGARRWVWADGRNIKGRRRCGLTKPPRAGARTVADHVRRGRASNDIGTGPAK